MVPSTAAALPSQHLHPWILQKALLPPVAEMQEPCQLPLLQHRPGSRYRAHLSCAVKSSAAPFPMSDRPARGDARRAESSQA